VAKVAEYGQGVAFRVESSPMSRYCFFGFFGFFGLFSFFCFPCLLAEGTG
jgi:hypothetical protein